jgi:hypothetical protein
VIDRRKDDQPSSRYIEFVRDQRDHDREIFDRLAYAKRALRLLGVRTTVALCAGAERLRVESGGLPGAPELGTWAIVSIPPDASRAHIAATLARLAGREGDPYVMDVLLARQT